MVILTFQAVDAYKDYLPGYRGEAEETAVVHSHRRGTKTGLHPVMVGTGTQVSIIAMWMLAHKHAEQWLPHLRSFRHLLGDLGVRLLQVVTNDEGCRYFTLISTQTKIYAPKKLIICII